MILLLCWPVVCLLLPHGFWHPVPVSSLCLARGGCAVWTGQPGLGPTYLLPCLILWQACASSHSLCSNLSSTWSLSEFPSPLGGPEATGETGGSEPHTSVRCYLPQIQGSLRISYVANTHSVPSLPTILCHRQARQGPGRLRTFSFSCVFVCAGGSACSCVSKDTCLCTWRLEVNLGCRFFRSHPPSFFF